jgi:hypothetical protein
MPQYISASPSRRPATHRLPLMVATLVVLMAGIAVTATILPTNALGSGSIRVTMKAQNHHPIAGRRWPYSVTVRSASGQKLSGTETTHYLFGSTVVGTEKPVNVRFRNGYYRDALIFPTRAIGHRLRVWVVIKTKAGSGSAAWWIVVVKR